MTNRRAICSSQSVHFRADCVSILRLFFDGRAIRRRHDQTSTTRRRLIHTEAMPAAGVGNGDLRLGWVKLG